MAKVFQRRDGSPYWYAWLEDPRAPDGLVKKSTKQKTKAKALAAVPALQAEIVAEIELEAQDRTCGLTWLDAVAFYLDPETGDPDLKDSSRGGYVNISTVVFNILGDFDLESLTHERIKLFCQARREMTVKPHKARDTGRKVTDQTIRNNLSMMSSVYAWVIDREHPNKPSHNPLKTFDRSFLRTSRKVDRHLRPMQFEECLTACRTLLHRTMLIVLVGTGLRSSELMNLRWPEVDFKNNVIQFGNCDPDRSKNDRSRLIPMLEPVADALKVWLTAQTQAGQYEREGLVFPGWAKDPTGKKVQRRRYDLKYLIKIVRSRTNVKGYWNHGLRHSFASWCLQLGIDPEAIRRALGHSTLSTTERYAHHIDNTMLAKFRELNFPVSAQFPAQTFGFKGGEQDKENKNI